MPKLESNVSSLVVSQLPDFIRGDYVSSSNQETPTYKKFINFIEAFYKFLEQETRPVEVLQNAKKYSDIDLTIDNDNFSLIETFYRNYGYDIPRNLATNDRFFLKRFRDLYKTKGSEEAAKLFFRALYDVEIDFFYPGDYIIKPSDGVWKKYTTILVTPENGTNVYSYVNTKILGISSKATAIVNNVLKINPNDREDVVNGTISPVTEDVYELYIENVVGTFRRERIVSSIDSKSFTNSQYQLVRLNIVDKGVGYQTSDTISFFGAKVNITNVDKTGGLRSFKILNSGYYPGFTTTNPTFTSLTSVVLSNPSKIITGNVTVVSNVATFSSTTEHGLSRFKNAQVYLYGNVTSAVNNTSNSLVVSSVLDDNRFRFVLNGVANTSLKANLSYAGYANIQAILGIVRTSEGFYVKNKGQPSGSYYIQGALPDSNDPQLLYYQPFSYVIKSPVTVDNWRNPLRSTIHPASFEVFGEILIDTTKSIRANTTGKSEVYDYFGLTADVDLAEYSIDRESIFFSKLGFTYPFTTDTVMIIFNTL